MFKTQRKFILNFELQWSVGNRKYQFSSTTSRRCQPKMKICKLDPTRITWEEQ